LFFSGDQHSDKVKTLTHIWPVAPEQTRTIKVKLLYRKKTRILQPKLAACCSLSILKKSGQREKK